MDSLLLVNGGADGTTSAGSSSVGVATAGRRPGGKQGTSHSHSARGKARSRLGLAGAFGGLPSDPIGPSLDLQIGSMILPLDTSSAGSAGRDRDRGRGRPRASSKPSNRDQPRGARTSRIRASPLTVPRGGSETQRSTREQARDSGAPARDGGLVMGIGMVGVGAGDATGQPSGRRSARRAGSTRGSVSGSTKGSNRSGARGRCLPPRSGLHRDRYKQNTGRRKRGDVPSDVPASGLDLSVGPQASLHTNASASASASVQRRHRAQAGQRASTGGLRATSGQSRSISHSSGPGSSREHKDAALGQEEQLFVGRAASGLGHASVASSGSARPLRGKTAGLGSGKQPGRNIPGRRPGRITGRLMGSAEARQVAAEAMQMVGSSSARLSGASDLTPAASRYAAGQN